MQLGFSIRSVCILLLILASVSFLFPVLADAQGLVPACPVDDPSCAKVEAYAPDNYGSCELVQMANNIISFVMVMSSLIMTIILVYAGYLLVTSRGNSGAVKKAKELFTNIAIGITIFLSAFLIVNTILAVMVGSNSSLLSWNNIPCSYSREAGTASFKVELHTYPNRLVLGDGTVVYYDESSQDYADAAPLVGNCSPSSLSSLGVGLSANQAEVLSCLAGPESGCNLNAQNPWTSARGVFQITRGQNTTCHNLNLPECAAAVGYSGNLNCSQAFTGGTKPSNPSRPKPGQEALFNLCNQAASNLKCNVAAAKCIQESEGWGAWMKDRDASKQRSCVAKYAN